MCLTPQADEQEKKANYTLIKNEMVPSCSDRRQENSLNKNSMKINNLRRPMPPPRANAYLLRNNNPAGKLNSNSIMPFGSGT
jgi:hypothetical protein